MTTVCVGGVNYQVPDGASISIRNNTVFVNGKPFTGGDTNDNRFQIEITGVVADVKVDHGDVTVHGNVTGTVDAGGNITCQNVGGDVDAGGNITCKNVEGNADAGGNIHCGDIKGDVDAGGNVRCEKKQNHSVRDKLAKYVEQIVQYGINSKEAEEILEDNDDDKEFIALAKLAHTLADNIPLK